MNWFQINILAIVQGITEFLPISSSGHLVIVAELLQANVDRSDVNIVLHAGTLFSIVVFYWRRIWQMLVEDRRVIGLLIVGTLPAVVIGLTVKLCFDQWLESPLLAGCMLPITGCLLLWASIRGCGGDASYEQLSYRSALLIGLFQAIAVLPGISRSGSTIVAGLLVGMNRRAAATFAFLLAIPAIAGATVLELRHIVTDQPLTTSTSVLIYGATAAFVVGLATLWWLVKWIERGRLHWFAYWCIPVGICIIVWQLGVAPDRTEPVDQVRTVETQPS